ncbi:hypothetical protein [Wolbachia endosymbiont of Brugia malayi]|nr:hypothetical protein [Wolbachia endosymbiont of Brugia malayi]
MLKHDPKEKDCKNKNIHTDHKGHLIYRESNSGMANYKDIENGIHSAE